MRHELPSVTVTDLQRSTKAVLEKIQVCTWIMSHGRKKGLLLTPELGEKLLAEGWLDGLLDIHTHDVPEQRREKFTEEILPLVPITEVVTASPLDTAALTTVIAPVIALLSRS